MMEMNRAKVVTRTWLPYHQILQQLVPISVGERKREKVFFTNRTYPVLLLKRKCQLLSQN